MECVIIGCELPLCSYKCREEHLQVAHPKATKDDYVEGMAASWHEEEERWKGTLAAEMDAADTPLKTIYLKGIN